GGHAAGGGFGGLPLRWAARPAYWSRQGGRGRGPGPGGEQIQYARPLPAPARRSALLAALAVLPQPARRPPAPQPPRRSGRTTGLPGPRPARRLNDRGRGSPRKPALMLGWTSALRRTRCQVGLPSASVAVNSHTASRRKGGRFPQVVQRISQEKS